MTARILAVVSCLALCSYSAVMAEQIPLGVSSEGKPQRHPYGFWKSPLDAEGVSNAGNVIDDVLVDGASGRVYYAEVDHDGKGVIKDIETNQALFGHDFSAYTSVHEYGGGYTTAFNGTVYFSNSPDNRVYSVTRGGTPRAVTPDNPDWRYGDFTVHPVHPRFIVGILEDHTKSLGCVDNSLAIIDTETAQVKRIDLFTPAQDAHSHFSGCLGPRSQPDFVDTPRFSPDGRYLVYRAWYHPYMSWEDSELRLAEIETIESDGDISLIVEGIPKSVVGNRRDVAVGEPNWIDTASFLFTSDEDGYFKPWIYNLSTGNARPVSPTLVSEDFGEAGWWLGMSNNALLDDNHAIGAAFRGGRSQFYVLRLSDGMYREVKTPFSYVRALRRVSNGKVVFRGTTDTARTAVIEMTLDPEDIEGTLFHRDISSSSTRASSGFPLEYISTPTSYTVTYPESGDKVHVAYYPPTNPDYAGGMPGELPPVIVDVHGGPTHQSAQGLSLQTQFFTTRGFGWLAVNYGGSMMYGRAYRERLLGAWGIVDVQDCVLAVRELGKQGLFNASRAVIRGGSAGGFTTFAAVANEPDFFAAGVSMFGVSDLRTLQASTHKYESHYLLKYVGGTPETDPELWFERSPISKADKIKSPLLILQGAEDPIVPPDQAVTMFETIKKNGGYTKLHLFEGEGHGWRMAQTITRSLQMEVAWYQGVFNGSLH